MPELHPPIVHAPDFAPGAWIHSEPLHLDALRGRVVLTDIWDYTCINCIRTLPDLVYAFTFTSCSVPDSAQAGPGLLFHA